VSPVKVSSAESVATSALQKHKPLTVELVEERRKGRDDPQVERASRRRTGRLRHYRERRSSSGRKTWRWLKGRLFLCGFRK
jgi:hypothetical protein